LGVTILTIVKTVLGAGWKTERSTKAIALYIGAAAKWAWIKIHVIHVPASAIMLADAAASENIDNFTPIRPCTDIDVA
jgi:hypothetical protein